ncbi:MAG: phosphotransferase, partial [Anaerolineae bacterium]|nr:phosphotransferase [Anaerolineae bacterium]
MKPFTEITPRGQVHRLRILAKTALRAYNLESASFHLLQHGENTTFYVEKSGGDSAPDAIYQDNRCLLRIHRFGYQNEASIASELAWLAALQTAGLPVPEPFPTRGGHMYTVAGAPGVPEPRVCSLLRWMKGRFYENNPQPRHFTTIGHLMARLHGHAENWQPPSVFKRRSWDSEGLFGDNGGFHLPKTALWARIPEPYAAQFHTVADKTTAVMKVLDSVPGARGLLHADLHLGNVLFGRDPGTGELQARPIDFDDCGYAHWVYDFAALLGDYRT